MLEYSNQTFDRVSTLALELTDADRELGLKTDAFGYSQQRFQDAENIVAGISAIVVMEWFGTGDPMFGGSADDRALTERGFVRGYRALEFANVPDALKALSAAKKRPHGATYSLLVVPKRG